MPYIKQDQRDDLDEEIDNLISVVVDSGGSSPEGLVNYSITRLIQGIYGHDENTTSYGNICRATGVLDNVKLEFYRKVAVPYEEVKEKENGPVKTFKK